MSKHIAGIALALALSLAACHPVGREAGGSGGLAGNSNPGVPFLASCLQAPQLGNKVFDVDIKDFLQRHVESGAVTSWDADRASGGYIFRSAATDQLTRRRSETAMLFEQAAGTAQSRACGPGVVKLARLAVNDQEVTGDQLALLITLAAGSAAATSNQGAPHTGGPAAPASGEKTSVDEPLIGFDPPGDPKPGPDGFGDYTMKGDDGRPVYAADADFKDLSEMCRKPASYWEQGGQAVRDSAHDMWERLKTFRPDLYDRLPGDHCTGNF